MIPAPLKDFLGNVAFLLAGIRQGSEAEEMLAPAVSHVSRTGVDFKLICGIICMLANSAICA